MIGLAVFGVHSSVLGGVETKRRPRVPEELRGRVQSVLMMLGAGGQGWGAARLPCWSAAGSARAVPALGVAMMLVTVVSRRPLGRNLPAGRAGTPATAAGEACSLP